MSTVYTLMDRVGDELVITNSFICYRNRSIDTSLVREIRVKGNRLTINHYKQNTNNPTMCILFPTKEDALVAHQSMLNILYSPPLSEETSSSWPSALSLEHAIPLVFLGLFVAAYLH